jgi:hypothetical protein
MFPDGKAVMMKVISNLITFRKQFPITNPADIDYDIDGCLLELSRTLRASEGEDYITINLDDVVDIYLTEEETRILAAELLKVADYKGAE